MRHTLLFASVLCGLFAVQETAAQTVLEEIIVTAQKREQNLRDVPISMSVLSGKDITALGMGHGMDIAKHTPGLNIVTTAGNSKPEVFLRGVGYNDFQSTAGSPIQIYNDGVIAGSGFGALSFLYDLERVEVLKGPQGTLWGANTTAGLLNFVSRKPRVGEELNGYVALGAGEHGDFNAEAAATFPFGDNVAARLSVKHSERDGGLENINPAASDDRGGGWDTNVLRAQLLWEPDESFSSRLLVSYADIDSDPALFKPLGNLVPEGAESCNSPGRPGTDCVNTIGRVAHPDAFVIEGGEVMEFDRVDSLTVALTLDYHFGGATLTSITSIQDAERESMTGDGAINTPGLEPFTEIYNPQYDDEYEGWTQELRVQSNTGESLNWVAGAYYQDDELDYFRSFYLLSFIRGRSQVVEKQIAGIFGELSYDLGDRLTLTGGLRLTHDRRETTGSAGIIFSAPQLFNVFIDKEVFFDQPIDVLGLDNAVLEDSWTEPSARVAFTYAWSDNANLYGSLSRGFRGGQTNGGATSPGDFVISQPEFLDALELGIKAQLFGNRLRLDVAGYVYDYTDKILQVEAPNPVNPGTGNVLRVENAATVEIMGLDLELDWLATDQLKFRLGASVLDAEFTEAGFELPFGGGSVVGNTPPMSPDLSLNGIVSYDWNLPGGATVQAQADAVWQDDVFWSNANSIRESQEAYTLVGARLAFISAERKWDASVWVRNLGDEEYFIGGFDFGGETFAAPGEPRMVGASVNFNF